MSLLSVWQALEHLGLKTVGRDVGAWPVWLKGLAGLVLAVGLGWLGDAVYLSGTREHLERQSAYEPGLKAQFVAKAAQGMSLENHALQLQTLQQRFDDLLRKFPDDAELPGLLDDISAKGVNSGLVLEGIKLLPEIVHPFYVELPIQVVVAGGYHDLATFVSEVAGLPRLVTLHDFDLNVVGVGPGSTLRMNLLARTYRYNPQELVP